MLRLLTMELGDSTALCSIRSISFMSVCLIMGNLFQATTRSELCWRTSTYQVGWPEIYFSTTFGSRPLPSPNPPPSSSGPSAL